MNSKKTIFLSKPDYSSNHFDELILNNFSQNNNILSLENELELFLIREKSIACLSSGTSAIHLALLLAGIKKGDEVLCQSLTFVASVNPIMYLGAKPVFIDSELDTWNMCPVQLERAILQKVSEGNKPKAILLVHIFGMPAKLEELGAIAKKYNITLIEDAAEALGSTYKKKKCGSFGDYGVFSFNQNKIITTSGGGALICDTEGEKNRAIYLASQAKDKKSYYEHSEVGYNYRMGQLNAALGLSQLKTLDEKIRLRREINIFYKELFKSVSGVTVFSEPNGNFYSNHWLTCILIDKKKAGFSKEDLRLFLKLENIETRSVWKPMHLQPVFQDIEYFGASNSEELFLNGLCLPSSSSLTISDKERIKSTINQFIKNKHS